MQVRKSILVLALLAGLLLVPQVQAQDGQTLTWGVTSDMKIRYSVTETSLFTPTYGPPLYVYESYEMIAFFSYFPAIREDILDLTGLPITVGLTTFVNGSYGSPAILVVPVGNWDLLQEVDSNTIIHTGIDNVLKNATYFEDGPRWGWRYNYTSLRPYEYEENVFFDCNVTRTQIFSKTDGAILLDEKVIDFFSPHTSHDFGRVIRTIGRLEESSILIQDTLPLLIIGVGATAAIALAVVYLRTRLSALQTREA